MSPWARKTWVRRNRSILVIRLRDSGRLIIGIENWAERPTEEAVSAAEILRRELRDVNSTSATPSFNEWAPFANEVLFVSSQS